MSESGNDDPSKTRYVRSLKQVAERLGVPYSTVIAWRDGESCPVLEKSPYDMDALEKWLLIRVTREIDPSANLSKEKLEKELRKLAKDDTTFSRNKTFWVAVAALGLAISREVRESMKEASPTEFQVDGQPKRVALTSGGQQRHLLRHVFRFHIFVLHPRDEKRHHVVPVVLNEVDVTMLPAGCAKKVGLSSTGSIQWDQKEIPLYNARFRLGHLDGLEFEADFVERPADPEGFLWEVMDKTKKLQGGEVGRLAINSLLPYCDVSFRSSPNPVLKIRKAKTLRSD